MFFFSFVIFNSARVPFARLPQLLEADFFSVVSVFFVFRFRCAPFVRPLRAALFLGFYL